MELRSRIAAAAGFLLGPVLLACGALSPGKADEIVQPGVVAAPGQWEWSDPRGVAPPRPYLGLQWEVGLRYWYSTGSHQFNLGGITSLNPLVSRLTWNDLTAQSAETYFRADHWSGVFLKSSLGAGSVTGGKLQDEDFPPGVVPYSSTNSNQRDGDIQYFNVDLGYTVWQSPNHRLGGFFGYGNWDERVRAFGCTQTAGNPGICVPALPDGALGITHKYDWQFWRLGIVGDARLWHGFSVSGEAAWLPGAWLSGSDTHHFRSSALLGGFNGPTPFDATSSGVQLEAVLKYSVTSNFDVGVGGRYWHVTDGDGKTHFEVSVPGAVPQFSSSSSERSGVFVQGSYRLN
jgi:outer membrane protease